jgi:GR25 family glycosyltransferase involved in LPS biosynthesis
MPRIPVCVISLPGDEKSYQGLANLLEPSPVLHVARITGVLGRALPDALCLALTQDRNSINYKGALGCFLSHVRAWETIAASDSAMGIVLEDDVVCSGLEVLAQVKLPADFEIVFLNDRTSINNKNGIKTVKFDDLVTADPLYHLDNAFFDQIYEEKRDSPSGRRDLSFHAIIDSLGTIEKRGESVGGDGYLLSRRGARKLLRLLRTDGYFSHVDIRLLAYCVQPGALRRCPLGVVAKEISNIARVIGHSERLVGYSTSPPLVVHKGWPSRRARQDQLGKVSEFSGE